MRVLLGVTGGIAAYKAVEVLRLLQDSGVHVEVAMTRSARRFVTPLTFSSLTGRPVHTSLWSDTPGQTPEAPIEHIALAQSIDALLIAPATANTLARLAHGSATDLLSTIALATRAPTILAPAMNVQMWEHPATQANVQVLRQRGVHLVEPESGHLACGMTGSGRLASPISIVKATLDVLQPPRDLAGEVVVITAGGTREPIDPVRYLGNRSSGRMGHALAAAAQARGAQVKLITASSLPAPEKVEVARVTTAEQMGNALEEALVSATLVIAAAAVADFRPAQYTPAKLRRQGPITVRLTPTRDLVADAVLHRQPHTLVIAFAAEVQDLEQNARAKLLRKGVDAVVANDVSVAGLGFESEHNAGLFLTPEATVPLPASTKRVMADRILDEVRHMRLRLTGAVSSEHLVEARYERTASAASAVSPTGRK